MKHPKNYDTDDKTSKRMANVKHKGGEAENLLAKSLWNRGYRYWRNYKKLPGSPDIAIKKHNIAIFVDGEFWHGYDWERKKTTIKRNRAYWVEKIEENMNRDIRNDKELKSLGWIPMHFWSKDVLKDVDGCVRDVENIIIEMM